jgi:hypothetical protein
MLGFCTLKRAYSCVEAHKDMVLRDVKKWMTYTVSPLTTVRSDVPL